MGLAPADAALAGARGCRASRAVMGVALGQGTPEKVPKDESFCLLSSLWVLVGTGIEGGWVCWGCRELGRLGWGQRGHWAAVKL